MERSAAWWRALWSPLAPFGRLGRLLGFRWVYFFTLPIPFHPLALPSTLVLLVGWVVWRLVGLASGDAGSAWGSALALLGGAAAVGVCLSIPILCWVVLVLGGRLVQAVLVLSAMVLLAVSAATGRDPAWAAVPPAVFLAVWAVQAVRGRVLRSQLRKAAPEFTPVAAQGRAVILGRSVDSAVYDGLLAHERTAAVWVQARRDGEISTAHVRITAELAAAIRDLARGELPAHTRLHEQDGGFRLTCQAPLPDDAIWVEAEPYPLSGGSLGGDLRHVTLEDSSWSRSVVVGKVSVVLPFPMFQCFHWVPLTSRSEWVVGFGHGKAQRLWCDMSDLHPLFASAEPAEPLGPSALDGVLLPLVEAIRDRDAAIARLRDEALAGPVDLAAHRETLDLLRRTGTRLLGDDAPAFLAAWLTKATQGRQKDLPSIVASLIATLSDDEIRTHGELFVEAFNSRRLGLEWTLGPDLDVKPLPRRLYRFGDKAGFGLVFGHPALYVRLGDLVPPFQELLDIMAGEMPLPDEVREAQARWAVQVSP